MSTELSERLGLLSTEELIGILECFDLEKWRPEVFPVVEGILRDRGLDVTGMAGRRREPDSEPRIPWALNRWKSLALASMITLASAAVGIPIVGLVGLYIGFSAFANGPQNHLAFPMALSAWWVALLAILGRLRRVSQLPYRSKAFAAAMVGGQAAMFVLPEVLPGAPTVFKDHGFLLAIVMGALIAFAFLVRAGRAQRRDRTA